MPQRSGGLVFKDSALLGLSWSGLLFGWIAENANANALVAIEAKAMEDGFAFRELEHLLESVDPAAAET